MNASPSHRSIMPATHAGSTRRALTLVEMVASLASAGILMAGLTSTMFIALKASNPSYTIAPAMIETSACLADMAADLQFALAVTEATPGAITVSVPDRTDADALPETIRYAWTTPAGNPLTRAYNGGAAANVLPGVYNLTLLYHPSATSPQFITVTLQRTSAADTTVQTSIPLVNMP